MENSRTKTKLSKKLFFLHFARVKELGPESNAKKKAALADGIENDSPEQVSSLSEGRHINNVDLALLCNHSVRCQTFICCYRLFVLLAALKRNFQFNIVSHFSFVPVLIFFALCLVQKPVASLGEENPFPVCCMCFLWDMIDPCLLWLDKNDEMVTRILLFVLIGLFNCKCVLWLDEK